MSVNVKALSYFQRRVRRLVKKFRLLDNDLAILIAKLEESPRQGKDLGAGLFKIRLASESKGGGKSGGFRVITYYLEQVGDEEVVYLVTYLYKRPWPAGWGRFCVWGQDGITTHFLPFTGCLATYLNLLTITPPRNA